MKPVIALIGRPNVGKSTLFNRLTGSRAALVADEPGLTRDRIYGAGKTGELSYIVIDTAGLVESHEEGIAGLMANQSLQAMEESNVVFFMVDATAGLTPDDDYIAQQIRKSGKQCFVVVNKTDGMNPDNACADFQSLGLGEPIPISAKGGRNVSVLLETTLGAIPPEPAEDEALTGIKIAIVGRPNVGKSTLTNRMLGEERMLVFDEPGTTRDSVYIPLERDGKRYTLIDTAGVRRRPKVTEVIEKFSVVKTLQAIEDADVVLLVMNAREDITDQDIRLAGFVLEGGKALVISINKWDDMIPEQRGRVKEELGRKLHFLDFAEIFFISALHGSAVGDLFPAIHAAYDSTTRKLHTPELTRILQKAIAQSQPPLVGGRRIKLRYAHQGGQRPPLIIIHGNQTAEVPGSYKRYLSNAYRKALRLVGTPVRIEFKTGENPFKGKKNSLTGRQIRKRVRLTKFMKKGGKK